MDYFGTFGQTIGEALSKLDPVLRKALQAHIDGDYEEYSEVITEELTNRITRENFQKAYEEIAPELGQLRSIKFLGSLNKGSHPLLIYAANYSGTSDDILLRVLFKNETDPPKIHWLWIE